MKFAAGSRSDSLSIGLQGTATVGATLMAIANPGSSGTAYDAAGASLPEMDFYTEVKIPVGVTSVRPFIIANTSPGSGAVLQLAQLGFAKVG